jgi:hypothetical protein
VQLAGVPVRNELVEVLANLVDEPTVTLLHAALSEDGGRGADDRRERIIRALDDPPAGLAELRGVLMREHEWRRREGLV